MKPPLRESSLQRAMRLADHQPPRAIAITIVLKRWAGILLVLSWIVFMILMLPAGVELSFHGWAPETYGGRFALPFGIAFTVMMASLLVWLLCGWILKMVGVE